MRHIEIAHAALEAENEWILFCDDDDTYEVGRVETFAKTLVNCLSQNPSHVMGAYESTFGKDHREHRHEYWCYCVRRHVLTHFFDGLRNYPDVLDNKCCDVLFAEFLRRLHPTNVFARITYRGYNYRVENNGDSVTGSIKAMQPLYADFYLAGGTGDKERTDNDYASKWNAYLRDNISAYLHDTYLRTLVGASFDEILTTEFKENVSMLDDDHRAQIREYHERVRKVCNEIYDVPIV